MSAVIEVKGLTKYFRDIKAVNDLSFTVPAGQVYGFLGQNGAGKSTTIRMLLTLITPDSGSIEIFGMDLYKHRKEILRQTGAIIEKPDLYKFLTATENLRIFAAMSGVKVPEKKLIDQLDMVGLAERANSKVKTYSQGMKQRLGIAVALVHDPQLIILDEPTNGLDPQGIADVRNLILHLSNDLGKTVFVSSHLLNEMELVADSMLIINRGKRVAEGSKQELLNPARMEVELVTDNKEKALESLKESKWSSNLLVGDNENILLEMEKELIPDLNRTLVEKGHKCSFLKTQTFIGRFFLIINRALRMMRLLQIEIYKIFKRQRTYIAFAVIAAIIFLIQIGLRFGGKEYIGMIMGAMSGVFEVPAKDMLNGYFVCFFILNLLLVHVPILVALIAGDMISGESNMGTLRLLASKPISRTKLLLVKFGASVFYTLVLLIWVAILSLLVSLLIFGTNSLFVPKELEANIMLSSDVLWRYFAAFGFAAIGLITIAAMAFMFSVFSDNSIGPIVGTVCVIIIFTILMQMEIPFYDDTIKPYLFTTHMLGWKGFFYVKAIDGVTINGSISNFSAIVKSALILIGYATVFMAIAIWYFRKKNILS